MTLDPSTGLVERIRYWGSIYVLMGAIAGGACGAIGVGFVKFTAYYLAEESAVQTLAGLKADVSRTSTELRAISDEMRDRRYADQEMTRAVDELNVHVHALDERADTNMKTIADSLALTNKSSQQILLLLQPQPKSK